MHREDGWHISLFVPCLSMTSTFVKTSPVCTVQVTMNYKHDETCTNLFATNNVLFVIGAVSSAGLSNPVSSAGPSNPGPRITRPRANWSLASGTCPARLGVRETGLESHRRLSLSQQGLAIGRRFIGPSNYGVWELSMCRRPGSNQPIGTQSRFTHKRNYTYFGAETWFFMT